MSKIVKIIGREIIDSRGNPTVEAEVHPFSRFHQPPGRLRGHGQYFIGQQ